MKTYTLSQLTSSRIQYDKKPPKFMFYIIISVLLLLIGLITLSCFTYKTEVVRTSGILSSDNKTYIQSQTSGSIKTIYKQSGDYVNEGDLLFELDDLETKASILALSGKIDLLDEYISNYDTLITTLLAINPSDISNVLNPFSTSEFYYMFKSFKTSLDGATSTTDTTIEEARQNIIDQYVQQYYSSKFQYEYERVGNTSQITAYETLMTKYKVYANNSGYINYTANISVGNVIDQSTIGSISNEVTESNAIFDCYVSAAYRSFIDIGTDVEVAISGLSQSKYGTLNGEIITIGNDIITDEDGNAYYKITIKPNSISLINKDNEINLTNGELGEIRIKYESVTWMHWMLKKIGIYK
jgi:membrane fusion protein, peptide pheromone/bacteriocin exporter